MQGNHAARIFQHRGASMRSRQIPLRFFIFNFFLCNFSLFAIGLIAILLPASMSEAAVDVGKPISGILGAGISDPENDVLLVQIKSLDAEVLTAQVALPLRSTIKNGTMLRIPIIRSSPVGEKRWGLNHWNLLNLAPGSWLAIAGKKSKGDIFLAEHAQQSSPPAQSGARLRRAINYFTDPVKISFAQALKLALAEDDKVSIDVLMKLASSDKRLPRRAAVDGLSEVLLLLKPDDQMARVIASCLLSVRLFETVFGGDDINQHIVGTLASRVLLGKPTDAAEIVPILRSALVREMDEKTRAGLLQGISDRSRLAARVLELESTKPELRQSLEGLAKLLSGQAKAR